MPIEYFVLTSFFRHKRLYTVIISTLKLLRHLSNQNPHKVTFTPRFKIIYITNFTKYLTNCNSENERLKEWLLECAKGTNER